MAESESKRKVQEEDLKEQQQTLETLKKEEQELKRSVEASRSELARLQSNSDNMEQNISQVCPLVGVYQGAWSHLVCADE